MKLYTSLIVLAVVAISSCTSAYKTGQTPDDVYFSPAREKEEYVRVEKRDDRYYRGSEDYYEDRFLRMRIMDRYRWSAFDDYYFYNTYAYTPYGNYYSWNSPWNAHWAWNTYYNPYCGGIPYYYPGVHIIKNPRTFTPPSRAIAFNPNNYINSNNSNTTGSRSLSNSYSGSRYNNSNSNRSSNNNNSSLGQSLRKVFSNSNSSSNDSYNSNNSSTPSRSYNPSSSSSSSSSSGSRSSGGSSSGGGVSRPPR